MNILVIGGTRFIGRHLVNELLGRGHDLTLFQRGETNPELFPQVDRIFGDREKDLDQIGDRRWDIVVDTCGYYPEHVELSVEYLRGKSDRYLFISSVAAYEPTAKRGIDEAAALQTEPPATNEVKWWHTEYAQNKAKCEKLVIDGFGDQNALIIRPGMVMGPHDYANYFTYWAVRMRQGGGIIAPAIGDQPLQFIDVRDLTAFTREMIEQNISGAFTVDGPEEPLTFGSFLLTLQDLFKNDATVHWLEEEWLLDHDICPPWERLPYWLPDEAAQGYFSMSNEKAVKHGLMFRPFTESAADVIDWYDRVIAEDYGGGVESLPPHRGLRPAEEAELLREYLEG